MVTPTEVVAANDGRERAVALVRRMRGVEKVVDNLRMNPAVARARVIVPDPELAQAVAQHLSRNSFPVSRATQESNFTWEIDGGAWDLEITVNDGDVILAGEAPKPNMIDRVIAAVRSSRGVRSVRSAIGAETFRRPYGDFPGLVLPPVFLRAAMTRTPLAASVVAVCFFAATARTQIPSGATVYYHRDSGDPLGRYSEQEVRILEKLNRADRAHLRQLPEFIVPDTWHEDVLAYSPTPQWLGCRNRANC